MENLKTLKHATPKEVQEIAKQEWKNNTDMQKFIIKKYDYYFTSDNLILEIEKFNNLRIDKTMYYDDETEAPKINLTNFIEYNEMNCNRFDFYKQELKHLTNLYFCKQNNVYCYIDYDRYNNNIENVSYAIRKIKTDEISDILKLYEEQKILYVERLTKYFNKYNKNISRVGYWANR